MSRLILDRMLGGQGLLVPHVQPIYRLSDARLMALEYLAHHEDDEGTTHTVGPLLQDPSLTAEDRLALDLMFLEATFGCIARDGDAAHLHLVNLEPVSLASDGFWQSLPRWLEALPFGPSRVVMEFTESQRVHDLEALQGYAGRLRWLGLRVAVDDLGAGVASLSHMSQLAPDFIKVDRSLVHQVHRRPYQAALLNALAHFAHAMRIGFIAEGIETVEELEAVVDAGVPWGQGYILGQPWRSGPLPIATSRN